MAITARIERMSASSVRSVGKTIAELASRIPQRSRSSVFVMSPRTKYTPSPAGLRSASWSSTTFVVYSSPLSSSIRSRAVAFQPQTTMWSR